MDTKQKILSSAAELFMRYGIKSVSMDDIARELGISKKTLYQVVDNKAELIDEVIAQYLEGEECSIETIRKSATDSIEEMLLISAHVTQVMRQLRPATIYDLQKYHKSAWMRIEGHHQEHVYKVVSDNILAGIQQGLYREEVDADIIARLYVSKSFVLVDEKIFPLKDFHRDKLLLEFIYYHIHGIASAKGLEVLQKYKNQNTAITG
ncbi:MAG: TetR/AcrR family transcriptional regulator [Saprospiraceae bacterium]|nr:TetR/AcrR family transcriptional regulator [Saprospiraceae bacterium]